MIRGVSENTIEILSGGTPKHVTRLVNNQPHHKEDNPLRSYTSQRDRITSQYFVRTWVDDLSSVI